MRPVNSDELLQAMRWYHSGSLPRETTAAIRKAMKSVDKCRVDGTWVLIASFRLYNRMMADTVPVETKCR